MKFGHLILKKIIKFVAHQMSDFKGKKGRGRERERGGEWNSGEREKWEETVLVYTPEMKS